MSTFDSTKFPLPQILTDITEGKIQLQAVALLQTLERRRTDIAEGKTGKMVSAISAKRATILSLDLSAYEKMGTCCRERIPFGSSVYAKATFL